MTTLENVKPKGAMGLVFLGKGNSKELELDANSTATRDTWVSSLRLEEGVPVGNAFFRGDICNCPMRISRIGPCGVSRKWMLYLGRKGLKMITALKHFFWKHPPTL